MKVLHINSYFNGSKFYKNLYDKQIEKRIDIDVFVPTNKDIKNGDFGEYTLLSKNHNKLDRLFFYAKHKKVLRDINTRYKIEEYSVLHAHSLFSNGYIAYRLFQQYGIPYIVAVRNTDINIFFKKMLHLKKIGIEILKNADKIIFISPSYKEYTISTYIPDVLREKIQDKSIVIPNGVDPFFLGNKNSPKKLKNNNNLNILTVGVVNKNKNQLTICKVIEQLDNLGINVRYTLIGSIKDKQLLKKITRYKFVNYISHLDKEELVSEYRRADIFIMASITETFGLTYVEAMSQGLPIIYTEDQGFDGQFKDGTVGYSVNPFNIMQIKGKLLDTIENYEILSKNCIELCGNYDWNSITDDYLNIYNQLLTK